MEPLGRAAGLRCPPLLLFGLLPAAAPAAALASLVLPRLQPLRADLGGHRPLHGSSVQERPKGRSLQI